MQFCTLGALTLQIELGDVDCAWCNTYIHVRIPPRVLHFSAFIPSATRYPLVNTDVLAIVSSDRHSRPSELLDETVKLVTLILVMLSFGMSIPFRRKVRPGERERDGRPDSRRRS